MSIFTSPASRARRIIPKSSGPRKKSGKMVTTSICIAFLREPSCSFVVHAFKPSTTKDTKLHEGKPQILLLSFGALSEPRRLRALVSAFSLLPLFFIVQRRVHFQQAV